MLPAPKLLVFDLDGTLVDSRIDLCNSVNATLVHFGRKELSQDVIASYIGDGVQALVRRALEHHPMYPAVRQTDLEAAVTWFLSFYRKHLLDFTHVYPGVLESLQRMRERHPTLPMAVLTNKPVHPSRIICEHLGIAPFCFQIYGGNSFTTKKPDPQGLTALIREAGVEPFGTVMIGDSHVDVETARAAGARSLGCRFGLSPETLEASHPDLSVDHASEWVAALGL